MSKIEEFFQQATVIDTETTGVNFKEDEIIEVAGGKLLDGEWSVKELLLGSTKPIPAGASAVNNISNRMIAGLPIFSENIEKINETVFLTTTTYMVAHNSNFDRRIMVSSYERCENTDFNDFLIQEDWICTWKLAQQLLGHRYDEIKYGLGFLRYFLDLNVDDSIAAHRATADVTTCGRLLEFLVDSAITQGLIDDTLDIGPQLQKLCWKPIPVTNWPLGKHKGKKITELPTEYLIWCIDNIDLLDDRHAKHDKDLSLAVENAMKARV